MLATQMVPIKFKIKRIKSTSGIFHFQMTVSIIKIRTSASGKMEQRHFALFLPLSTAKNMGHKTNMRKVGKVEKIRQASSGP